MTSGWDVRNRSSLQRGNARVSTHVSYCSRRLPECHLAGGSAMPVARSHPYRIRSNVTVHRPGGDLTRDDNGDGRPMASCHQAATIAMTPVHGEKA